jgi:uncharacterized membrane protein
MTTGTPSPHIRHALAAAVITAALAVAGSTPAPAAAPSAPEGAETPAPTTTRSYLRDRHGRFTTIEPPGATLTKAGGVNIRGEIVGGYYLDDIAAGRGTQHGFLRDRRGRFTRIDIPGAVSRSSAFDINDHGHVVGLYDDAAGTLHGFLRDRRGRLTTIDHPDAGGTSPLGSGTNLTGITNRGEIVGNYSAGGTVHGFLRDRTGRFRTIDRPGAAATYVTGVNDRGQLVGISGEGPDDLGLKPRGFLLDRGVYAEINLPGATGTTPNGISNRGAISGTYTNADGTIHGFLRNRRGGYRAIDHPDAVAPGTTAYSLNNRGQITGAYQSTVEQARGGRPAATLLDGPSPAYPVIEFVRSPDYGTCKIASAIRSAALAPILCLMRPSLPVARTWTRALPDPAASA